MLETLNPQQQEAVMHTEGPVMVIAGAGSGKTKVLTTRIQYLLEQKQVNPENILAVTFTNKAAREMEKRIGRKLPWIGTFHGVCGKLLRKHIQLLDGYSSSYVIFDDKDQETLIKNILKELGVTDSSIKPGKILSYISNAKNKMISPKELAESLDYSGKGGSDLGIIAKIYRIYQESLRKNNAVDFDDMLLLTIDIFEQHPQILSHYQDKFRYILVDEYQDTNKAQYTIIKLLAAKNKNICVVGDSDQSIYSWRGADMGNILSFEQDWPKSKVVLLEQNYRSTKHILQAANAVIKNNITRKEKNLWTNNDNGEIPAFYYAATEKSEVRNIVEKIQKHNPEYNLNSMAIFYRTNAQSRVFEEELINRGIKYRLIGGVKFYQRKEIKDILAYLRIILNPNDEIALNRIINLPARGIGGMSLTRYKEFATEHGFPLFDALGLEAPGLTARAINATMEFKIMIKELQLAAQTESLSEIVDLAIHKSGYHAMLLKSTDPADLDRIDNVFELVTLAKEKEEELTLATFLEHLSLMADIDNMTEATEEAVTLMTIHSAKGLEFPLVFIAGMEEGVLPHFRSLYDSEALEEERRLCYVAITRAEQKLYLSAARQRTQVGETRFNDKSRFIAEIPSELLDQEEECAHMFGETDKFGEINYSQRTSQPTPVIDIPQYHNGERVFHSKWGQGTILKIFGSGEDQALDIQFTRVRKTILAKYAKMEKI